MEQVEDIIWKVVAIFLGIILIPVILALSAAKREAVWDIIGTAVSVDAPWEIRAIIFAIAIIAFLSIPTWGLLLVVKEVAEGSGGR